MTTSNPEIKRIIEAALLAYTQPLGMEQLKKLFESELVSTEDINEALQTLIEEYQGRGIELKEVASGFRFQICQDLTPWVQKLWQDKPPRYSRATLETLALIIYKQPITRAEIEEIRGVAVSTNIIKTLTERGWIRVVGQKEMPGKPALYGTNKQFLDDFNIKSLADLPAIMQLDNYHDQDPLLLPHSQELFSPGMLISEATNINEVEEVL